MKGRHISKSSLRRAARAQFWVEYDNNTQRGPFRRAVATDVAKTAPCPEGVLIRITDRFGLVVDTIVGPWANPSPDDVKSAWADWEARPDDVRAFCAPVVWFDGVVTVSAHDVVKRFPGEVRFLEREEV